MDLNEELKLLSPSGIAFIYQEVLDLMMAGTYIIIYCENAINKKVGGGVRPGVGGGPAGGGWGPA